jgi:hypothetical protein
MIIRICNFKIYIPYSSPIYTILQILSIAIPAIIMGGGFLAILWLLG